MTLGPVPKGGEPPVPLAGLEEEAAWSLGVGGESEGLVMSHLAPGTVPTPSPGLLSMAGFGEQH